MIPLRGGSKGIPKKNIKEFSGKPLCYWSIKALCQSKLISEIYVSTDSNEIKNIVNTLFPNIKILDRPKYLAADETSTEEVMLHFSSFINFDTLITVQVTSPFVKDIDFDQAILKMSNENLDSLFTGTKFKRFIWDYKSKPINYDYRNRKRRQDFQGFILENGAFYITKRSCLEINKCRLGGNIGYHLMEEMSSIEIDNEIDWILAEKLFLFRGK